MAASSENLGTIDYGPYFRDLIVIQKQAIASFKRWVGVFAVLGILIIAFAIILSTRMQGVAPQVVGIGGIFFSALGTFPYREILPRESRIKTYALLQQGFEKFPNLPDEDRKRLRDLADEAMRKQI